jgi:hypothetical protein
MTKNETKDSDLPYHTMDPHGVGWRRDTELMLLRVATVRDCGLAQFRMPIYRALLLVFGVSHIRTTDTKNTDLWCQSH